MKTRYVLVIHFRFADTSKELKEIGFEQYPAYEEIEKALNDFESSEPNYRVDNGGSLPNIYKNNLYATVEQRFYK